MTENSDILNSFRKVTGNKEASIVSEGIEGGDVTSYISTGSYLLNAQLSGSIFKGYPKNKTFAIAGESTTGKTFIVLGMIKTFLDDHPKAFALVFETEGAYTKDMFDERGIDSTRVLVLPVVTVQEFRHQALNIIQDKLDTAKKDWKDIVIVLDSLGNISTEKEMEDSLAGKSTQDMTRAKLIKSVFRVLRLKTGKADIPMLLTNHTYMSMDLYPKPIMSGGRGIYYASDNIIYLTKAKEKEKKDGKDVIVGNQITCTLMKGRGTKENTKIKLLLRYDLGLNPYWGLAEMAVEMGIWHKTGNYCITAPQGQEGVKHFFKAIYKTPEKFFTQDVLDAIDAQIGPKFLYGSSLEMENENNE